jgi:hypothetical protein
VGGGNGNTEDTDLEVLAAGPNWNQTEINNGNNQAPDVFQWVRGGGGGGGGGPNRLRRSLQRGGGGGGGRIFMLNADIAIVRDLEGADDNGNVYLEQDGEANCSFRFPRTNRCPLAATLSKAGIYRSNNSVWLGDFKAAMTIMLEKGMAVM